MDAFAVDVAVRGWKGGGTWPGEQSPPLVDESPQSPSPPAFPLIHTSGLCCLSALSGVSGWRRHVAAESSVPLLPTRPPHIQGRRLAFSGKVVGLGSHKHTQQRGSRTDSPPGASSPVGRVSWSTGCSIFSLEIIHPLTLGEPGCSRDLSEA